MKVVKGLVYGHGVSDVTPTGRSIEGKWRYHSWYTHWNEMLRRVYGLKFIERNPSYEGCSVSDEWLLASNFKRWYDENEVTFPEKLGRLQLDKDLLFFGNKMYSPFTARLVPSKLNSLFTNTAKTTELPVGVHYAPFHADGTARKKPYTTQVQLGMVGQRTCTRWETVHEAEAEYKRLKHLQVIQRVEECRGYVCDLLLDSVLKRGEDTYGDT